ncbi:HAD family hydrolase [Clostridium uliginosum]|uniref:Uncharacterized protein n=1 Tax=Clostridium uliginosum TaxID=119641 RepID=A0A1I1MRE2_9CLOT|nr:HAD family phosphatase [Clostridium uliginosum]SFC87686.1 haloacid dehalogenase superfamily, subfamily IA, variant 3 with third motif having DD or ED/haloacid dehalogenase superfamily, subfamily IA, variant 1 with third motif having Dx(3-4)D or Dx(3-4)E/beta-phosphoglucomutase family hydrolase [Clostridium uliginosum]
MKDINAVIFDMDGLLFDTEQISFESFRQVIREYGLDMEKELHLNIIGRNVNGIKEKMMENYGQDFPFDKLYEQKTKVMTDCLNNKGVPVKKGVYELLDYLKKKKYKIAVATSTRRERAIELLEMAKIKDKFDCIVCGDEVINSKPDPEIFLKAAKKLDVPTENCIVLEDSGTGIRAAHAAGIKSINVPDMKKPDEQMKKLALRICESLLEVKTILESE